MFNPIGLQGGKQWSLLRIFLVGISFVSAPLDAKLSKIFCNVGYQAKGSRGQSEKTKLQEELTIGFV
jgi:hypothetical protein